MPVPQPNRKARETTNMQLLRTSITCTIMIKKWKSREWVIIDVQQISVNFSYNRTFSTDIGLIIRIIVEKRLHTQTMEWRRYHKMT